MPSSSKAQQKFMGLVHAYKKGEVKGSEVSKAIKKAAKSMKKSSTKKYASTKHKGLPNKVKEEGFGGDLKGEDKKRFEKARKANGEQLGYKLSGTSDIKESVNEGKFNPNKIKIHTNKAIGYLKQAQKFAKEGQKGAVWQRIGDARDELKMTDKFLESVNEATSLGADMLLGGIATVIKKAGMRPKTAKMMGGGFKVSKRDKVGFKIDVEIRGLDKKKTFPLQFETERGMLYVVIKNKPIKLGKYTMATQSAQNLKKIGAALIGDKDVKKIS